MRVRTCPEAFKSDEASLLDLAEAVDDLSTLLGVDRDELISELTTILRRRTDFESLKRSGQPGRDTSRDPAP